MSNLFNKKYKITDMYQQSDGTWVPYNDPHIESIDLKARMWGYGVLKDKFKNWNINLPVS